MKKTLLSLSFLSLGVFANASVDMDHIDPIGAGLITTPGFGVMQVFPDFLDFSGTVIDDFNATLPIVDHVAVAFELSSSSVNLALCQGWRLSFWTSVSAASNSGATLDGGAVYTTVLANPASYATLSGTGALGPARLAEWDVNIPLAPGHYWIGMAPILEFVASGGQTFILSHTAPAVLGANTPLDSVGINPTNGFGLGTQIPVGSNAAYYVHTIPEPATMVALGIGLVALARRRRK